MKYIILTVIKFYQKVVSPFSRGRCRFTPTCSNYAYQAVSRFGAIKGCKLAIKRILKCHPFSKSWGYDPVPERED
jgi:putative membrane protein insertion efficiency factor